MARLSKNKDVEVQRRRLRDKLVQELRKRIREGESLEDVVVILHDEGLSIPESVWVLQKVSNRTVAQLKNLVTMHAVWEKVVQETEPLHDELEKALSKPLIPRKNRAKARQ